MLFGNKTNLLRALSLSLGTLFLTTSDSHALCNGMYEWAIHKNHDIVSQFGDLVYDEDWSQKRHSFVYRSLRDSWAPGVGIVYDIVTQPRNSFRKREVAEREAVNESIRTYGVAVWQDQILVNNILRDALFMATENKSFQRLYADVHAVKPDSTPQQMAGFINGANYAEHFCLEEPEPIFIRNEFGKNYPTDLVALFSYDDIKNAVTSGVWNTDVGAPPPTAISPPDVQSYPIDPGLRPGHVSRAP